MVEGFARKTDAYKEITTIKDKVNAALAKNFANGFNKDYLLYDKATETYMRSKKMPFNR